MTEQTRTAGVAGAVLGHDRQLGDDVGRAVDERTIEGVPSSWRGRRSGYPSTRSIGVPADVSTTTSLVHPLRWIMHS